MVFEISSLDFIGLTLFFGFMYLISAINPFFAPPYVLGVLIASIIMMVLNSRKKKK